MTTKAEARTMAQIKEILIEVSCNPGDYDLNKTAMEIYILAQSAKDICGFCGIDLAVEREMFSQDKLFTKHSCKGG